MFIENISQNESNLISEIRNIGSQVSVQWRIQDVGFESRKVKFFHGGKWMQVRMAGSSTRKLKSKMT